jgi:DNA-binding NarL/FixJ family response regulator
MTDLRILIIADNPLARAGLAALLADQPGVTLAGQVAANETLPDLFNPDMLLYDLGWDPTPSLGLLADLAETGLPVVVLLPDDTHAPAASGMLLEAVAFGLLLRDIEPETLLATVQAVARGLVVLDPELAAELLPEEDEPGAVEPPAEALTPRELEVLQLLAEGLANKAIARRLDISDHTVKFHVNAIMGKLNAQSRTEAVVRATRLGLIIL